MSNDGPASGTRSRSKSGAGLGLCLSSLEKTRAPRHDGAVSPTCVLDLFSPTFVF